jgi:DNA-binding IclR family transcriptional regulator
MNERAATRLASSIAVRGTSKTAEEVLAKKRTSQPVSASPRALTRFLEIIDLLSSSPSGLTLAQLGVSVRSPKSSLLAILRPLCTSGHLVHTEDRYQLGPSVFRFASKIISVRSLPPLIKPIMQRLSDASRESVYFAVIDREEECVRYVEGIESQQLVRYAAAIGAARPLYCGAGALVLLAHQPQAWSDAFLKRAKLEKAAPATVTDRNAIKRRLAQIRKDGFSVSKAEVSPSAAGVAAPVFDPAGEVFGALVIAAPIDRFEQHRAALENLVVRSAAEASGF